MITVIAEICVKPGRRTAVLQAIEKLTPTVLQEEGGGSYQALIDHKAQVPWKQYSPDSIFMVEHWKSLPTWNSANRLSIWSNNLPESKMMYSG